MVGTRPGRADSTVMGPGDRLVSGHVRPAGLPLVAAARADRSLARHQATGGKVKPVPRPPARRSSQRGDHVGANPVDRGNPGSKLHLVCDGSRLPLTAAVTAANVNDTTMFQAVMDDVPPIRTPSRRRRTRPGKVHADKSYDSRANRSNLRRRGIRARIARRGVESSTRLGRHRWKVERSLSWLSCFRRLRVRWDRDSGRWFAFVLLACVVVSFNRLSPAERSDTTAQPSYRDRPSSP
jgi:transposase